MSSDDKKVTLTDDSAVKVVADIFNKKKRASPEQKGKPASLWPPKGDKE